MWHNTELFTSESKAQVYGCLHEFLQKNPVALNNIGKSHPYVYAFTIENQYTCVAHQGSR